MRNNPFENQLERLARTLTDQFGVKVICRGEEAWTDGRQIVLPAVPDPMDTALERMVLGFLDHEMAHVAFSDFGVVKSFSDKHPGFEPMLNVVEDALIERRAMDRWPGVRANLDAMFAQIRDRVIRIVAQRDAFGRFCTAVYLKLSHHQDMLGIGHLVDGYADLFDWFPAITDTHGAAELAEQILERWLKQNPPEAPAPPPQASDGNADDEGDVQDDGAQSGEEAEDPPRQSQPDDGAVSDSDADGDSETADRDSPASSEDEAERPNSVAYSGETSAASSETDDSSADQVPACADQTNPQEPEDAGEAGPTCSTAPAVRSSPRS